MFHPLAIYVGLRYVRARTHKFFVSFITWVSLVGVCVGVAALIVILSVMNGFEGELRDRLLSLSAHARIVRGMGESGAAADWARIAGLVRAVPGVVGAAPYIEAQALAVRSPEMLPVVLRGIDPQAEPTVTEIAHVLKSGRLADLTPGSGRAILGEVVAEQLGLALGDTLTLLVPIVDASGTPAPRLRELKVAGTFEVGLQEHDGTLLYAQIGDSVPSAAPARVDRELGDDERLEGLGARVIYTPGHTDGSIAFLFEEAGVLFTGDVATEHQGQVVLGPFDIDRPRARQSFRKFAGIEVDTVCFGHGQPLVGEETNKLKAAAKADEVPDPLG